MQWIRSAVSRGRVLCCVLRPTSILVALSLWSIAPGLQGAAAQAQPPAAGTSGSAPNCAVTTARIGGLDVTEFFGLQGGASSFSQNFISATPVAQRCVRLELANPAPGDLVPIGGYVIEGFVFDPNAPAGQGSGMNGVQVFLDDPNQGGQALGEAPGTGSGIAANQFGLANSRAATFGDQFLNSGFRLTVQIPASAAGAAHALFVSAQSTGGARVGAVAVPIAIGALTPGSRILPVP